MNKVKQIGSLIMGSALALALVAGGASASAADKKAATSGFLDAKVEAKLKDSRLKDDRHVHRWLSRDLNGKNYHAIMVDRTIYYPAPNPGPQVSSSTLDAIAQHLTYTLKSKLGDGMSVVDKAGPGVLRMQPALTSVTAEKEGMSAVDILPVALLFHAAKSASGSSNYETKAHLEVRVTDSVSGDYVAAVKMDLEGKTIDKDASMSLADVQKVLDQAANDGANTIIKALH
jgi:hypothetical protein